MPSSDATPRGAIQRLGGGLELALACDFGVARTWARLGLPEVGIGRLPGAGGTQRLTRLAGPSVATRLILGAELIDGGEAERLGIVQWAKAGDAEAMALALALALAQRLAVRPAPAYGAAKRCIAAARGDDRFAVERREIRAPLHTSEAAEHLARFVAKDR
jgi:enoyl-CoA hydratase/carnithine racemase